MRSLEIVVFLCTNREVLILAHERVQVKYLPNQLEIYYEEGTHIMTIPRISGKPGLRILTGVLILDY